jgi:hypothetical protein
MVVIEMIMMMVARFDTSREFNLMDVSRWSGVARLYAGWIFKGDPWREEAKLPGMEQYTAHKERDSSVDAMMRKTVKWAR